MATVEGEVTTLPLPFEDISGVRWYPTRVSHKAVPDDKKR